MYTVKAGDSLWRIAWLQLGDPERWVDIASLNLLRRPERLLVGQRLHLPLTLGRSLSSSVRDADASTRSTFQMDLGLNHPYNASASIASYEKRTPLIPARAYLFFFMDEFDPFTKKLTRKVGLSIQKPVTPQEAVRILNPETYGITAKIPGNTHITLGRHVLGMTDSKFISTSDLPAGSPRLDGKPFWIDVAKLEAAGVTFHSQEDIQKDLDRIKAKLKKPESIASLERIRELSRDVDKELVLEGFIPAAAVKGASAMKLTRVLRVVEGVGLILSAYDLARAGHHSYQTKSVVPLAEEAIRQSGGWGGAWAGAQIGGAGGAALGIETGPGALLTGAAGALIFGTAGFFGADWATKRIFGERE